MKVKHLLLLVAVVAGLIALGIWHAFVQHWLAIHTGTIDAPSPYSNFFGGFGSDVGEVTILGGLITAGRHINCHEKGCWRFGHPVEGSDVRSCHRHHPTNPRLHRNGSVSEMHRLHRQAKK